MNYAGVNAQFLMLLHSEADTYSDILVMALNEHARAVLCWQGHRYKLSICKIKRPDWQEHCYDNNGTASSANNAEMP